jgi:soluble lytic murein transglycosylase-like protein
VILCLSLLSASLACAAPSGIPADPPPDWTEDAPVLSRLLEQAYAAQVAGWLPEAADRYCQAARLGQVDAQYRLGHLLTDSADPAQRAQGLASLALAAQRGHGLAQALLAQLQAAASTAGKALVMGDPPQCQLTGEALALAMPALLVPPPTEAVPHEVVERYVLALPADKRRNAQLIQYLAPRFSVDPRFALAIARAESNFDAEAVSPKNAQGLMQLIPDTAERFGVRNIRDPEQNVRGGLAYLKWLLARFDGDVALASAAYNAGERAVERHGGVPPYAETQDYVKRILRFYRATVHSPPVSLR